MLVEWRFADWGQFGQKAGCADDSRGGRCVSWRVGRCVSRARVWRQRGVGRWRVASWCATVVAVIHIRIKRHLDQSKGRKSITVTKKTSQNSTRISLKVFSLFRALLITNHSRLFSFIFTERKFFFYHQHHLFIFLACCIIWMGIKKKAFHFSSRQGKFSDVKILGKASFLEGVSRLNFLLIISNRDPKCSLGTFSLSWNVLFITQPSRAANFPIRLERNFREDWDDEKDFRGKLIVRKTEHPWENHTKRQNVWDKSIKIIFTKMFHFIYNFSFSRKTCEDK